MPGIREFAREQKMKVFFSWGLQVTALLTFQSSNDEVNDVEWCPTNSAVFGTATSGGRVEIWDIGWSTVRPAAFHVAEGAKISCLLFSEVLVMLG